MPIINVKIPLTKKTLTVSELNQKSRQMLEGQFRHVLIEGELSNLALPRSGHIYFRLKDNQAQIQCAFFKNKAQFLNIALEEGMQVVVTATVSLYEARGDYQLIIDNVALAGIGQLQQKFEALKKELQAQGLFDNAHKKSLPQLPKKIGIITSPTGAALQDIISTLKRRFPAIPLCLYPTQVQGTAAAKQIVEQIQLANAHNECEVLILARGGGSLEDLWPFNEAIVAHAIYQSHLPIVSGIGHEVDTTLADFCADLRAATPTAAAESVTPHVDDVLRYLQNKQTHLINIISTVLLTQQKRVTNLKQRLRNPQSLLYQKVLHIEALNTRLNHALHQAVNAKQKKLQDLTQRLLKQNPRDRLHQHTLILNSLRQRLIQKINHELSTYQQRFSKTCATLHATSPLATLDRGYSLILDENKRLITSSKQLTVNQVIEVRLKEGEVSAKIIR